MRFWGGGAPHRGQKPIWDMRKAISAGHGPRTVLLACGRRWGKDQLSKWLCLYVGFSLAWERRNGSPLTPTVLHWVVAPTYKLLDQLWEEYTKELKELPGCKIEKADMRIRLRGGYVIQFRSTEREQVLAGVGLDVLHVTEAGASPDGGPAITNSAWDSLKWCLVSPGRLGFACINGTPNIGPPRWFVNLWSRGEDSSDPGVVLVNEPTWSNPTLSDDDLREILAEAHRTGYSDRFLAGPGAKLILEAGGVFRRVGERHVLAPEPGMAGCRYVTFYDPARSTDYNAVVTFKLGDKLEQVYADRWTGTEWPISRARLAALKQYPGDLYIDTGFDPYGRDKSNPFVASVQSVVGQALYCRGFRFDSKNKERMTEQFALLLEDVGVDLLDPVCCDDLEMRDAVQAQVRELREWTAKRSPSGHMKYEGGGDHDDMADAVLACVMMAAEDSGDAIATLEKVRWY